MLLLMLLRPPMFLAEPVIRELGFPKIRDNPNLDASASLVIGNLPHQTLISFYRVDLISSSSPIIIDFIFLFSSDDDDLKRFLTGAIIRMNLDTKEKLLVAPRRLNVMVNAPSLRHQIECIENETLAASIIGQMKRGNIEDEW
ncbi:hypothetical protein Tco_1184666 [Tanacetum coccineum]